MNCSLSPVFEEAPRTVRRDGYIQRGLEHLLDRVKLIGMQTGSWSDVMVQQRGPII